MLNVKLIPSLCVLKLLLSLIVNGHQVMLWRNSNCMARVHRSSSSSGCTNRTNTIPLEVFLGACRKRSNRDFACNSGHCALMYPGNFKFMLTFPFWLLQLTVYLSHPSRISNHLPWRQLRKFLILKACCSVLSIDKFQAGARSKRNFQCLVCLFIWPT